MYAGRGGKRRGEGEEREEEEKGRGAGKEGKRGKGKRRQKVSKGWDKESEVCRQEGEIVQYMYKIGCKLTCPCLHGPPSYEASLYQFVRVVSHDLAVLTCSRLPLVCVHHQVAGTGCIKFAMYWWLFTENHRNSSDMHASNCIEF